MGVLDDAIREHLDLKRRHGAAEEELRRQEEEALGPARREMAPADSEDGDAAPSAEVDAAPEPELSEAIPDEAVRSDAPTEVEGAELNELPVDEVEPEAAHEEPPAPAPAAVEEPEEEPAGDTPPRGLEALDDDEMHEDEQPHEDEDRHEDEERPDDDEFLDDEDERADEDADVLEDTPDFLQETPEHDRLWFEQKPPRDFDFD